MFTGIITDLGEVVSLEQRGDTRLAIACAYPLHSIATGTSISCAGICLTVVDARPLADGRTVFSVDASAETLARTSLSRWKPGTRVNLEQALKVGDELGGHFVTGHVDGIAGIAGIASQGASKQFTFTAPREFRRFIAPKGSICLDGTSFTVNETRNDDFDVNIIPHTLKVTSWGWAKPGDSVNVEIDMLARYVARIQESLFP